MARDGWRARLAGADWREIDPAEIAEYVTEAKNPGEREGRREPHRAAGRRRGEPTGYRVVRHS
jgi:hypothetical protein